MEPSGQGGGQPQLMELLRAVATQEEGNALCHRVLQAALRLLLADRASLYLVTRGGRQKYLVPRLFDVTTTSGLEEALCSYDSESNPSRRLALGEGIIGTAARGRTPLFCNSTSNDSLFQPQVDLHTGYHTRSILASPVLNFRDKVIGVASVLNKTPQGHEDQGFTEHDGKVLQQLTVFCAIAIATLDPQGLSPVEMSRHDVIRILAETIMEESNSLGTLVPAVMQQITTLIKCERCLVFIAKDPESDCQKRLDGDAADAGKREAHSMNFREMYDYKLTTCNPKVVKLKTFSSEFADIAFRVLATGSWVNMDDWQKARQGMGRAGKDTGGEVATHGLLAGPVTDSGLHALATLLLANRHDGLPFSPTDVRLSALVCVFLGLGLHSALPAKEAGGELPRQRVALAALGQHIQGAEPETLMLMEAPRLCGHDAGLYSPSFQLDSLSDMDTLRAALAIFVEGGFIRYFELPREVVCRWVCCVYKNHGEGGYHSWRHAVSTTQAMYALLNAANMADLFGPVEMLAILAACLCHDLDHQEASSFHRPLSASALASLYSSNFHERYHFTSSVLILERPGHNIFSTLSTADYRRALACMGLAVQATDLSTHFYQRDSFKDLLGRGDCSFSSSSERLLLMSMLVTAADLGTFTRPFSAHLAEVQPLLQRLEETEKQDGVTSSVNAEVQVMFIDWICLPVYEMLSEKWPNIAPWMDNVIRNRETWMTKSSGREGEFGEEVRVQRNNQERRRRPGSRQRRGEDKSPLRCEDPDQGGEAEERPAVKEEKAAAVQVRLHAEYLEIVRRLKEVIEQQKAGAEAGKEDGRSGQNADKAHRKGASPQHLGIPAHLEETTAEPDLMEVLRRDKERRARKLERGRSPQETTPSKEVKEQGCQQEVNIDVYPSPQLRNIERSTGRKEEEPGCQREVSKDVYPSPQLRNIERSTRRKEEEPGCQREVNKDVYPSPQLRHRERSRRRNEEKQDKGHVPTEGHHQENKKTFVNKRTGSQEVEKRGNKEPRKEQVAELVRKKERNLRPQNKARARSRSRSSEELGAPTQEKAARPPGRRDVGSDPMATALCISGCHWSEEAVRSRRHLGTPSGSPCRLPLRGVSLNMGEGTSTSAEGTLGSTSLDPLCTGTLTRWEEAKSPHKTVARCLLSPGRGADEANNATGGKLKTKFKSLCGNVRYAETQNKASNHPGSDSSSEASYLESRSFVSVVIQLHGFPADDADNSLTACRGCQTEESVLLESILATATCWKGGCGPCSQCGKDHCKQIRLEWTAPEGSPFFTNLDVDVDKLQDGIDAPSEQLVRDGKLRALPGPQPILCPEELSSSKLAEMERKVMVCGRCFEGCQAPCCGSDPNLHCHETLITWEAPAGSSFFTNCPIDMDKNMFRFGDVPCLKALQDAVQKPGDHLRRTMGPSDPYSEECTCCTSCPGPETLDPDIEGISGQPFRTSQPLESTGPCACGQPGFGSETLDVGEEAVFGRFPAKAGLRGYPTQQCTCDSPQHRVRDVERGVGLCACDPDEMDPEDEDPLPQPCMCDALNAQAAPCRAPHIYTQTSSVTVSVSTNNSQEESLDNYSYKGLGY